MVERAENGGGYGGLPEDYGSYGDREHGEWHEYWPGSRGSHWVPTRESNDDDESDLGLVREADVARFNEGDRVKALGKIGGVLFARVPAGTEGRVVESRTGVLTEYVTVSFANGYTEECRASDLERLGWW